MFFVGWKYVAVCTADVIVCNECCRIVHIFDGFKDIAVYFGLIYGGVWFYWTEIEGAFCGESIVEYCSSGCVLDATVVDRVLFIVG